MKTSRSSRMMTSSPVRNHPSMKVSLELFNDIGRLAQRKSLASSLCTYPSATDGIFTCSSPGSLNPPRVPSYLTTLATMPRTRRPVLPGTPSLVSVEHMEIVPAAPVVPGEHVEEMFRLFETCSDINVVWPKMITATAAIGPAWIPQWMEIRT